MCTEYMYVFCTLSSVQSVNMYCPYVNCCCCFLHCLEHCKCSSAVFLHCLSICKLFVVFLHCLSICKLFVVFLHCLSICKLFVVFLHCLSICKLLLLFFALSGALQLLQCSFFCTVCPYVNLFYFYLHCLEHAHKNFTHQGTCAVVM